MDQEGQEQPRVSTENRSNGNVKHSIWQRDSKIPRLPSKKRSGSTSLICRCNTAAVGTSPLLSYAPLDMRRRDRPVAAYTRDRPRSTVPELRPASSIDRGRSPGTCLQPGSRAGDGWRACGWVGGKAYGMNCPQCVCTAYGMCTTPQICVHDWPQYGAVLAAVSAGT